MFIPKRADVSATPPFCIFANRRDPKRVIAAEEGTAFLEFALCLGFLCCLFFGLVTLGFSLREHNNLVEIARLSARAGANDSLAGTPSSRARSVIDEEFQSFQLDQSKYSIELGETLVNGRDALFVRIRRLPGGVLGLMTREVSASATYVVS